MGASPDRAGLALLLCCPVLSSCIRAGKSPAHTPGQVSGLLWVPERDVSRPEGLSSPQ